MKALQIACTPENWDNSTITAVGITRNGRTALPKSTAAKDLPEPWLAVWHAIVKELQKLDPNGWAATFIQCTKYNVPVFAEASPRQASANLEEAEAEPETRAGIHLLIHRRWDDATTAEPVELDIDDQYAVELFDWLTADEANQTS